LFGRVFARARSDIDIRGVIKPRLIDADKQRPQARHPSLSEGVSIHDHAFAFDATV
jgi:hypothetical protein